MSANVGALSHLVEAATALADMQPKQSSVGKQSSQQHSNEDNARNKREIFPERLMSILNDASLSDIVTWLPHGRSFVIIRPDVFAEKVMPTYFPSQDAKISTKYPSFTRKLNRWGFRQATRGPDTGAFHHPLFRRDQPQLCLDMVCQRSRNSSKQSKAKGQQQSKSNVKIAPLTKASLDAIIPATAETTQMQQQQHVATVSVSDESNSDDARAVPNQAQAAATNAATAAAAATVPTIKRGISSDKDFVQRVLKDHEEMERLRIAKVMLYRAYVEALQGAQGC